MRGLTPCILCCSFTLRIDFHIFVNKNCLKHKKESYLSLANVTTNIPVIHTHAEAGSHNALWPPVKHCNSLSLPALAVLNMQLVYSTSLLAKLPILIRMFEKKTKQEKVKALTDRSAERRRPNLTHPNGMLQGEF